MSRTVYVVTWTPDSVGGFEWRADRDAAERVAADFRTDDGTVRVHTVSVPVGVNVTDYLDAEGWSDGGPAVNA
jgi:YD repeat-containing protein